MSRNSCYEIVVFLFLQLFRGKNFARNCCHRLQLFRAMWNNYSGVLQLLRDNFSVGDKLFVNTFCVHVIVVSNNFSVRKSCAVTTIPWFTTFTYSSSFLFFPLIKFFSLFFCYYSLCKKVSICWLLKPSKRFRPTRVQWIWFHMTWDHHWFCFK